MPTIRTLIVDDSPTVRRMIRSALERHGDIAVVGEAESGELAVAMTVQIQPDVVVMDLTMAGMGGVAAIEQIMSAMPVSIIVVSGRSRAAVSSTLAAIHLGAADYIPKYLPGLPTNPHWFFGTLIRKVRAAADLNVRRTVGPRVAEPTERPFDWDPTIAKQELKIVVIGASTGGPVAVREFVEALPDDCAFGVVVVQHLPKSFTKSLVQQLDRNADVEVREARDRDRIVPGTVWIVPGDRHATIEPDGTIHLVDGPKVNGHRPSIDVTMKSVAKSYGSRAAGVLLTGMGTDGVSGLLAMRTAGARTFAQNAESCAVFGMPQRALECGAAESSDRPLVIARKILQLSSSAEGIVAGEFERLNRT